MKIPNCFVTGYLSYNSVWPNCPGTIPLNIEQFYYYYSRQRNVYLVQPTSIFFKSNKAAAWVIQLIVEKPIRHPKILGSNQNSDTPLPLRQISYYYVHFIRPPPMAHEYLNK